MSRHPPNIVLFLTDDHGAWAQGDCAGLGRSLTPALDTLAARGACFPHAFTPSPVCSPARACLLAGRPPSWLGLHDWLQESDPAIAARDWLDGAPTLFTRLSTAGYFTGLSGKWHLGRSHLAPAGCDWHFGLPGHQGVHQGEHRYVFQGRPILRPGSKTAHLAEAAIQFLQQAPRDRPFFLNVGFIATHSPYKAAAHDPRHVSGLSRADFSSLGEFSPHPWAKNEGLPQGGVPDAAALQDARVGYVAGVAEIDAAVGRIVDALTATGRLEDTLILYTSDHGCSLGQHGFLGKGNSTRPLNMHEASIRVPLIVAGPGVAHSQPEQCVDHYDTFQALLDCAKASRPEDDLPGRSYAPLLRGEKMPWDDSRFGEYGDLRMLRTRGWKYVHRYPSGPHDLFDLQSDPKEVNNLAESHRHQPIRESMQKMLEAWFALREQPGKSGLRVKSLLRHNPDEAWRDGRREARGLQVY